MYIGLIRIESCAAQPGKELPKQLASMVEEGGVQSSTSVFVFAV
jgi:hypothetical protein